MSHSTPKRIVIHRPDLEAAPRPPKATAEPLKAKPATPPTVIRQVRSAAVSLARWIAAGRPMRTLAQLADVQEICKVCPHWKPSGFFGAGRCLKCGCSGLKQEWATESCPDDPPRWLATHVDT